MCPIFLIIWSTEDNDSDKLVRNTRIRCAKISVTIVAIEPESRRARTLTRRQDDELTQIQAIPKGQRWRENLVENLH